MEHNTMEQLWNIMQEAFPPDERRTRERQLALFDHPRYHVLIQEHAGALAGFLAYWQLDGFYYVEHLAVDRKIRGQGIGQKLLDRLLAFNAEVILEVEIPKSEDPKDIENRRINFYSRSGFRTFAQEYYHPAYDGSGRRVPLLLMGNRDVSAQHFETVRREIFTVVHGISGQT